MWLPLRAGAEVSSHGVMLSRGSGHTSFPPGCLGVAKALSTHSHHRGSPLKERRKAEKGGHCGMWQWRAMPSLISDLLPEKQLLHLLLEKQKNGVLFSYNSNFLKSCSWRDKMGRGGRGAKTNLFFQKHADARGSFSPRHVFGVKSHLRWISRRAVCKLILQTNQRLISISFLKKTLISLKTKQPGHTHSVRALFN